MPCLSAIWIDRGEKLPPLARTLESHASIGVDTEFLRERTFFPKLCLLQLAAGGVVWCVDTLRVGGLDALVPALTAAASRKVIHSARQDLEAFYLNAKRVISPVFDTQIAAGCIGLKPQIGYAELVKTLWTSRCRRAKPAPTGRSVRSPGNSWNMRPTMCCISSEIADRLTERLRALGREQWVLRGLPRRSRIRASTSPTPRRHGRGCAVSSSCRRRARARARSLAVWREQVARERDLPRGWIISDAAIFDREVSRDAPRPRRRFAAE